MKPRLIDARGMGQLLFLILAADLLIRPFSERAGIPAQIYIPAALLTGLLVLLATHPCVNALTPPVCDTLRTAWKRRTIAATTFFLFTLSAAGSILHTGLFFDFISDFKGTSAVGILLPAAVILYAAFCGPKALARAFGLMLWLLLISLMLLLISIIPLLDVKNLIFLPFQPQQIIQAAWRGFLFPAQIPLFIWLTVMCADCGCRRYYARMLLLALALSAVLSALAEMLLGVQAQVQNQTIYAMARLGSLSVFQRLDALHNAAWLLISLLKAAAFSCGAEIGCRFLVPPRFRKSRPIIAAAALMLALWALFPLTALERRQLESILSLLIMAAAAVQIYLARRAAIAHTS